MFCGLPPLIAGYKFFAALPPQAPLNEILLDCPPGCAVQKRCTHVRRSETTAAKREKVRVKRQLDVFRFARSHRFHPERGSIINERKSSFPFGFHSIADVDLLRSLLPREEKKKITFRSFNPAARSSRTTFSILSDS